MEQRLRRERRRETEARVVLDGKGEALLELLPHVLKDFEVEVGVTVDEVTVTAHASAIPSICALTKKDPRLDFNYLRCMSAVDYIDRLEVVYHLFSLAKRHKMVLKTSVSPDEPHVPSIVSVWSGANWFEREAHDLYGVVFEGHPDLSPLLLYEGFEGYPGRKSFPFHDYDEW